MPLKLKKGENDLEPDISPFGFYIDAFKELSTCRSNGGPIPFTAIIEYVRIYSIEDREDFIYLIRVMDNFLLIEGEDNGQGNKTNSDKG